jgi:hypothetical protein
MTQARNGVRAGGGSQMCFARVRPIGQYCVLNLGVDWHVR